jgi:hypothetical protein
MQQKLAELLLLSNSPDIDSNRVMAAAGSLWTALWLAAQRIIFAVLLHRIILFDSYCRLSSKQPA